MACAGAIGNGSAARCEGLGTESREGPRRSQDGDDRFREVVIPFKRVGSHVVVTGQVGKAKCRFIVDTGAAATIIERFVARNAGITSRQDRVAFSGINSEMHMQPAIAPTIQFSGLQLKDVPVHIYDPDSWTGIPAFLGMDVLGKYVVAFDFQKQELRLSKGIEDVPANSVVIPLVMQGNPYVVGTIDGTTAEKFLLDTGCGWPVYIDADEAKHAGLATSSGAIAKHADLKKKTFVIDANIRIRHMPRLRLKTLDVGTVRLVDVDAAIVESTGNIIGIPFLEKFSSAIFDFPGQRLILVRKKASS